MKCSSDAKNSPDVLDFFLLPLSRRLCFPSSSLYLLFVVSYTLCLHSALHSTIRFTPFTLYVRRPLRRLSATATQPHCPFLPRVTSLFFDSVASLDFDLYALGIVLEAFEKEFCDHGQVVSPFPGLPRSPCDPTPRALRRAILNPRRILQACIVLHIECHLI